MTLKGSVAEDLLLPYGKTENLLYLHIYYEHSVPQEKDDSRIK